MALSYFLECVSDFLRKDSLTGLDFLAALSRLLEAMRQDNDALAMKEAVDPGSSCFQGIDFITLIVELLFVMRNSLLADSVNKKQHLTTLRFAEFVLQEVSDRTIAVFDGNKDGKMRACMERFSMDHVNF